jgi:signal transduction histidine kinase
LAIQLKLLETIVKLPDISTMQKAGASEYKKVFSWQQELLLVVGLYLAFAVFYFLAIRWSSPSPDGESYYSYQIFLDYPLKGLITIPIWWFFFRVIPHWSIQRKALLHLLFLPLFVKVWQQLYYLLCELLGMGYLRGHGEWWDIYIPALFYVLQFGLFHSYDYYQKTQEAHHREMLLKQSAMQSELTALKAQLNPHFLYNAFNTISASVPATQEYTRELIAVLADLFRYQLWASEKETVLLKDEISFLKKYLQMEKARFGDRLQVIFNIAPEVQEVMVLPMLLQPLVENAIKHGISPLVNGGSVSIVAKEEDHNIRISVTDTGVGFAPEQAAMNSVGIGLKNTRRRVELAYQTSLQISSHSPQGTIVSFLIPKEDHA